MATPLVFAFTCTIPESNVEAYERYLVELYELVGAQEPRLHAMETFYDATTHEVTSLLIQPDSEAQEHHMKVAGDKLREGYELLDFTTMRIDVYGRPGESVLGVMRKLEENGVLLTLKDRHLGGVNNLSPV